MITPFIDKQNQKFKSWQWEKDNKKTKHKTEEIIAHRCRLVIEHLINNQPDQLIQAISKLKEKNILIADKLLSSKAVNSLYQTILKTKDNSALGFLFKEFSHLPITKLERESAIKNGNVPLFKLCIQKQKIYNQPEPYFDYVFQECLNLAAQYKQTEIIKEIVELSNKHKDQILQSGLSLIDFAIKNDQSDLIMELFSREVIISSKTLEITKKKNKPIIFDYLFSLCKNYIQIRVDLINAAFHFKDQDKLIELLNSGLETYSHSHFLYNAAEKGLTEVIVKYLELKPFTGVLNTKYGPEEWTLLHMATSNSHQDAALKLIEKGADPYAKSKNGFTPFYNAAEKGLTEVIVKCLELNSSTNLLNTKYGTDEYTPLHAATDGGHQDAALKLIEKGADPYAKDKYGFTPFYYAAREGLTKVIVKCLEVNPSADLLNTKYGPNEWTPLHDATAGGREDIALKLIQKGADPYAKDIDGDTPFYFAAKKGLTEVIVKCLEVNPSADLLNTKGYYDSTPLHAATYKRHQDIALKLIEKGADPYAKDKYGFTPFYYAAREGLTEVIEKCLELNPSADLLNTKYGPKEWTPLHDATFIGHQDAALKLIEKGADPYAKDKYGFTPFYYAARERLTKVIVKCLEVNPSAVNTKYGTDEWTPLHTATYKGQQDIALKLIEKGADPLATDSGRNTSLHMATSKGFKEIALLLINNGALTNIMNSKGETPLDLLTKDNNWDLKDATEIDENKYPVDYINIAHEHNNTISNFFVHKEIAEKCEPIKKARKDYSSAKSIPLYGDFSHEVFKLYLQFLHIGEINITHDNFKDIAMAAHLVNSQEILKKLKDWVAGHPECENWKRHTEKPYDLAEQRYKIREVNPADKQEVNPEETTPKNMNTEVDPADKQEVNPEETTPKNMNTEVDPADKQEVNPEAIALKKVKRESDN